MYPSYGVQSVDSIIMSEIVKAISEKISYKSICETLLNKIPRIILLLVSKKLIEDASVLFGPIKQTILSFIFSSLYMKKIYKNNDVSVVDYYICKAITEDTKESMLLQKESIGDTLTVRYMPFTRSLQYYEEVGHRSFEAYNKLKSSRNTKYEVLKPNGNTINIKVCTPSILYPSSNYKKLCEMIHHHFNISALTSVNNILGILINGVPGLGKTKFADYAAQQKLCRKVRKIDMTSFLNYEFENLLNMAYFSVDIVEDNILMIDELDKYIDYRVRVMTVKNEDGSDNSEIVRINHLFQMLKVLERDDIHAPVIVIFCSNNFTSIFDGIDLKQHESLYNRFMKVQFEQCDHEELVSYMTYYSDMLKNTPYSSNIEIEEMKRRLRNDIRISHRDLHHISVECMYNNELMIEKLNSFVPSSINATTTIDNNITSNTYSALTATTTTTTTTATTGSNILLKNADDDGDNSKNADDGDNSDDSDDEEQTTDPIALEKHNALVEYFKRADCATQEMISESQKTSFSYMRKSIMCDTEGESIATIVELLDFIESDAGMLSLILGNHQGSRELKQTIERKILEFLEHDSKPLFLCKESTKKFIFALTGKHVE